MLNFENIEGLVSHMFENLDNEDSLVSVITNREMVVEIMHELLDYENVILNCCDIDFEEEYGWEYIVSLLDDVDSDKWYVSVEKCYLPEKEKYVSTEGYVLFHEDVNSKAMIDMQKNEYLPLGEHDWFTIGEDDESNEDDGDADTEHTYTVNGKNVDKEVFDKYVSKFAPDLADKNTDVSNDGDYTISVKCNLDTDEALEMILDMERRIMHMNDMFREMDCFRRLFHW